jgi:MFS family permease
MKASEPAKASPLALGLRMLSSLKNPSYRIYFFGNLTQFGAMSMQIVTNPLLIYRLTASKALLGTMSLVHAAPMIAISVFGGAFADRIQKKKIIIAGFIGSAVVSLLVGMSLATGLLNRENPSSWSILFIASAVQGVIMGLMLPALQAIIPEIVGREYLMNAVALNTMGMNVLNLVAPGVAGFIIGTDNFKAVYFTMSGLNLCGALFILFIPARSQVIARSSNIMSEIQKGFGYIRQESLILAVLAFTLIVTVLSMPYQQLLPVYVDDILKVGAKGMGLLLSVSGAGALVGSLILMALPNKKRGLLLLGSGVISGIALTVFSFSSYFALSLSFIFFIGLSQAFRMTIGSTLLQAYAQGAYMGRVMSLMSMQWGVMSICTFLAGVLAEVVDVQWILGSMAMLLAFLAPIFLIVLPSIRKIE